MTINKKITALSFLVVVALGYLVLSGASLFLNPAPAERPSR